MLPVVLGFAFFAACKKDEVARPAAPESAAPEIAEQEPVDHQARPMLSKGDPAPSVGGTAHTGEQFRFDQLQGKPAVVYFYPKDDTPGCTVEAHGIRDAWDEFTKAGVTVVGVSTDDNESHAAFAAKHHLPFALLPDPDGEMARAFGVPMTAGFAGRVTFVIDREGKIAKVFPDVDPSGHAEEILEAVRALPGS